MTVVWILTWIGQSVALVALTSVFVRLPGCLANAAARCVAWTVAIVLMACLAVSPLLPFATGVILASAAESRGASAANAIRPVAIPATPAWGLAAGATVWALGSLVWIGLSIRDLRRVGRLKRAARPLLPAESRRLRRWLALTSRGRQVRLCWCDELDGPAVLGFSAPVVALPRAQGARLTHEELEHVLLHELAHVRRRDDWAALIESVLVGLMWVNPAVHLARRRLALAREMACDDWVVAQTATPVAYARCLTAVASLRSRTGRIRLAAAATGRTSALTKRVTRVLRPGAGPGARMSRTVALLTPLGVGVAGVALLQMPPLIVSDGPGRTATSVVAPAPRAPDVSADLGRVAEVGRPAAEARRPVTPSRRSGSPAASVSVLPRLERQVTSGRERTLSVDTSERPISREDARHPPLLEAAALPGVGMPGVTVAGGSVTSGSLKSEQKTPWWGRAAGLGATTGDGATTAGRATASFLKRMGTRVAQPFTR